jgi:hypothetical protein
MAITENFTVMTIKIITKGRSCKASRLFLTTIGLGAIIRITLLVREIMPRVPTAIIAINQDTWKKRVMLSMAGPVITSPRVKIDPINPFGIINGPLTWILVLSRKRQVLIPLWRVMIKVKPNGGNT